MLIEQIKNKTNKKKMISQMNNSLIYIYLYIYI